MAAIATPQGAGGLGIVRLSGKEAVRIARAVFRPAVAIPEGKPFPHARALFGSVLDRDGEPQDRGYLTFFHAPRSYTGEPTAEISTHASPVVLQCLLDAALAAGARAAEPGEFTYRAFRNGKLDLAQAEAVADLIAAQTSHQARVAYRQMEGGLARELEPTRQELLELMAHLEASLEFPEEDGTLLPLQEVLPRLDTLLGSLQRLVDSYTRGRMLRRGATVVLCGAPNVGKSSLFNRLLGTARAIVTASPGTTRDVLAESVELGGIPVRLVDTAGLGASDDPIVAEGVRRAEAEGRDADLVLLVLDRSRAATVEELQQVCRLPPDTLVLLNKSDLPEKLDGAGLELGGRTPLEISALTGAGMDALLQCLAARFSPGGDADEILLTRRRQHDELNHCVQYLQAARQAAMSRRGEELILIDLHEARLSLGRVTGSLELEDVYNSIFSKFCIGK